MSETVRTLQRRFARLLFDEAEPATFSDEVRSDGIASADERLSVYAHMYRARLIEVLGEVYPLTRGLVGEDEFDALAARYVHAHPSRTPSLRAYGGELSRFLAEVEVAPAEAASLAALEWARYDVFDALDEPTLTREDMAALGPGIATAPLRSIVASALVPCAHTIDALYLALAAGNTPPVAAATPCVLLVWRESPQVFHRVVSSREAELLRRVASGTTLGLLCEALAEKHAGSVEAAAAEVFALVGRWIADGLLAQASDD
jgi:hypothetical protein